MNLTGDLRYVADEEYAAFIDEELVEEREHWYERFRKSRPADSDESTLRWEFDQKAPPGYFGHRRAFRHDGYYGKWLLQKPIIAIVNKTAFVHGGLPPYVAEHGLTGVNNGLKKDLIDYVTYRGQLADADAMSPIDRFRDVKRLLPESLNSDEIPDELIPAARNIVELGSSPLHGPIGPTWYRGTATCNPLVEADSLNTVLDAIGATRIVMGHTVTITRRIQERMNGRVVEIDTGMLNSTYGGSGNALVIEEDQLRVINQAGTEDLSPIEHPVRVGHESIAIDDDALADILSNGKIIEVGMEGADWQLVQVMAADRSVTAVFRELTDVQGAIPELAAYRLDRLLGLGMVPVTVRRAVAEKDGTLQFVPAQTVTERERVAGEKFSSASCPLQKQFDAMNVFDALIDNPARTPSSMLYSLDDLLLLLVDHESSFTTSGRHPAFHGDVHLIVGAQWKLALSNLHDDVLQARLGDVLDDEQMKALRMRRDALIQSASDRDPVESPVAVQDDYAELEIAALQQLMRNGDLTSAELTTYYLQRIDAIDQIPGGLNAIIEVNPEALDIARSLDAERQATGPRGPLHGIPVVLKANIDTADRMTTTAGSLALQGHYPTVDAFHVTQLREAGAVILAKANLSEWANFRSTESSSGWSSVGGQTNNPYGHGRNPCGSSSGSAVAVAASLTSVAVGTETNGSVVCPSSVNGIVGIKPSLGLVSRSGIIPIAHSQDTAGPMGRTVRDAAILLTAMVGMDADDPLADHFPDLLPDFAANLSTDALKGARIGIFRGHSGAGNDERVETIVTKTISTLESLGAEVIDPIEIDKEGMGDASRTVLYYEFKADLNAYLEKSGAPVKTIADIIQFNNEHAEDVMPFFGQERMLSALDKGPLTDPEYLAALALSKKIAQDGINNALAAHNLDALIAPTRGPAWMTDNVSGDRSSGISSSSLAAVSGYASITLPAGDILGLPIGISFIGGEFSDAKLIQFAYALEQAGYSRKPPIQ
jgi:amidase